MRGIPLWHCYVLAMKRFFLPQHCSQQNHPSKDDSPVWGYQMVEKILSFPIHSLLLYFLNSNHMPLLKSPWPHPWHYADDTCFRRCQVWPHLCKWSPGHRCSSWHFFVLFELEIRVERVSGNMENIPEILCSIWQNFLLQTRSHWFNLFIWKQCLRIILLDRLVTVFQR